MSSLACSSSSSSVSAYVTNVYSTGPAGGFSCPMDLTLDLFGNLYVCDGGNNQVVCVDVWGNASVIQTVLVTDAAGFPSIFHAPVQMDASNNVLPNTFTADQLHKLDVSSNPFSFPEAMVFDRMGGTRTGNMFVMDCTNTIYRVAGLTRAFTPYATINGHYLGLTIDRRDTIYYSSLDYLSDTAKLPTPAVYRVAKLATGNAVASMFIDLTNVMVYPGGLVATDKYLFVADMGGNAIAQFDLATGKIVNAAFITLTPANNLTFDAAKTVAANAAAPTFSPYGGNQCNFAIDPVTGDFVVLCGNDGQGNNTTVARYSANGKFVGNMATTADGLNGPIGVAVDKQGRVFVSNQNGNNVCVITKAHP